MNAPALRQITIHKSLTRPILLAGAERELVILNGTIIAALILGVGITKLTIISAIFLATLGQISLALLGKRDPQMSRVYIRHIHFKSYYQARGSRLARTPLVHPSIVIGKNYVAGI